MNIATLAIIVKDGKVLLGLKKRGRIGKGTVNGPGGHMEDIDLTVEDCIARETLEELGIVLLPEKLEKVAVITFYSGGKPDFKVHVFKTDAFRGEPCETEDMVPGWYDIDNLPISSMLESDKTWFPQLIQGEKFNANVYYRERAKGFEKIEFLPFSEAA